MVLPALLYIAWDAWFTSMGIWSFNEEYISGIKLINLPIEEVLFFFVVPYCCTFIYACIRAYFPRIPGSEIYRVILLVLIFILIYLGITHLPKYYTSITFLLTAFFLILLLLIPTLKALVPLSYFLISYAIVLIPFLIVNGFLTAIPVVSYNDAENLGVRITTIPIEDAVYGMLLFLLNIVGFEYLRKRAVSQ